jgi:ribonuclease P/MRP protein subunit POP5
LPSLREKKRYIAFEVISDNKFSFDEIKEEINKNILNILGEKGYSRAGIMFININKQNKGIVKTNNKELVNTRAALTLINEIKNKRVIIKCRKVSGILKKVKNLL